MAVVNHRKIGVAYYSELVYMLCARGGEFPPRLDWVWDFCSSQASINSHISCAVRLQTDTIFVGEYGENNLQIVTDRTFSLDLDLRNVTRSGQGTSSTVARVHVLNTYRSVAMQ